MNQCLRCQNPCEEDAEFCDNCRAYLQNRIHQNKEVSNVSSSVQDIDSIPVATNSPIQLIEQDISGSHQNYPVDPESGLPFSTKSTTLALRETKKIILTKIEDIGEEVSPQDVLDPLSYRKLPTSDDATIAQNEDVQPVPESGVTLSRTISTAAPPYPKQRLQFVKKPLYLRLAILCMTPLVIGALITSSVLVVLNINHQPVHMKVQMFLPSIRVMPGAVYSYQVVQVQLTNFSASARIRLTRDGTKNVRTDTNSSTLTLGTNGTGNVQVFVDESWGSGTHTIEAEDITTHYTASTELQVLNEVPSHPPHLIVTSPGTTTSFKGTLNMGSNEQGANTLQALVLQNRGGGWITWSATSNQPWLLSTPRQGIFQDSQNIIIAVSRTNLKAGDYAGIITIISNSGAPISLHVSMTVLPLTASEIAASPVLQVSLPALSFVGADGGANPVPQSLKISNTGSQPLNWSLSMSAVQNAVNQNESSQDVVNWLSPDKTSGTVTSGKNSVIHIKIQSNNALPGVYYALFTLDSGRDTLNAPQVIAVSLTIQPACGIATNQGSLSFTSTSSQYPVLSQSLSLSVTAGCSSAVNWESFSSASWLSTLPASGQLQVNLNSMVTVQVDTSGLQPGLYTEAILLVAKHRSLTIVIQVMVTSTNSLNTAVTSSGSPMLGLSTRGLQFTMSQGQVNPANQSFIVSNNGLETLNWQASFDSQAAPWLSLNPTSGSIGLAQSMPIRVSVRSADLPIGVYNTQITLIGTDSSGNQVQGSPQIIQVTLSVLPQCSFQASPSSLTFTGRFSKPNPPSQDVLLNVVGSCPGPVHWTATVNSSAQNWLVLSTTSGTMNSQGSSIVVKVKSRLLFPGNYSGLIVISSQSNALLNNPLSIPVTLTVIL